MPSNLHYAAFFSFLFVSSAVLSQELEVVEVIGRSVNLIGSATSASEGRISQDEFQRRPLLRTGDLLESVPGLVATQHSGSGKANQFFLRGFNLDHGTDFSTVIDGMPVNMRSHGHGQGYTDINFIIPELIEEIRFRKGSYFADAGDFSAAGSAHFSTARYLDSQSASLGVGEYGFSRLLVSGALDNSAGNLIYGLEHQQYEGPWDSVNEDVGRTNVWLKQRWGAGEDQLQFMFMGYDNSWNSADQIPARAVQSNLISEFGSIDPSAGGDSSRYSVSANWQRNLENGSLRASVYGIDYEMELYSNFSYFTSPQGDQFQQVDQRKIYGGSIEWRQDLALGFLALTNTYGVQIRIDDIGEVGLRSSEQRRLIGAIRLDAVEEKSMGLYWQNEMHWSDSLRSVFGLRYNDYDFDVQTREAANAGSLLPNSGSSSDDIVTASISLIYKLDESSEIYASIGQGFHSNDARGTTIHFDPVSGDAVLPVDPLVDTLGSEIGFRAFLTDRLNASVALWLLDIDSELIFVGDAGNTEDTGLGSERKGVEVTSYFQLNNSISVDMEYSWADSRFTRKVNGFDAVPGALSDVISGGISLSFSDKLQAALRVRYFDDYGLDGGETAEGSTLFNLRLIYAPTSQFSVTADLLNLFDSNDRDVEYFYESQLINETASVGDHHYHVFEPRSLRVYFNYRF
ncbi:MAG: TonB-dependent receptor [Gammaproteobacteria bacterium]|nr:TonB-dependent receptor [Gammaproteobacteria bacterium]MDG2339122.1 TonB-dependent receptor [Gammaproteobacteria bacterium]